MARGGSYTRFGSMYVCISFHHSYISYGLLHQYLINLKKLLIFFLLKHEKIITIKKGKIYRIVSRQRRGKFLFFGEGGVLVVTVSSSIPQRAFLLLHDWREGRGLSEFSSFPTFFLFPTQNTYFFLCVL